MKAFRLLHACGIGMSANSVSSDSIADTGNERKDRYI